MKIIQIVINENGTLYGLGDNGVVYYRSELGKSCWHPVITSEDV